MSKKHVFAAIIATLATLYATSCCEKAADNASAPSQSQTPIENIMTRASVRQFTDQPIPSDTLETLVKAGMAAPTAVNKQPWDFVVVTDRIVLDSLMAHHPHANLKTATAAIIVCGNLEKALPDDAQAYWIQDCSAATENILLAAHSLGLGAVWCGVYPIPERIAPVSATLQLPSHVIPLNIISMGYPAAEPQPKDKWNPEAVHYNVW